MNTKEFSKLIINAIGADDVFFNDIHFENIDYRYEVFVTRIQKDWIVVNIFDNDVLIHSFRMPYECDYNPKIMVLAKKFIQYYQQNSIDTH